MQAPFSSGQPACRTHSVFSRSYPSDRRDQHERDKFQELGGCRPRSHPVAPHSRPCLPFRSGRHHRRSTRASIDLTLFGREEAAKMLLARRRPPPDRSSPLELSSHDRPSNAANNLLIGPGRLLRPCGNHRHTRSFRDNRPRNAFRQTGQALPSRRRSCPSSFAG